jgi:hypothetical protein
MNKICVLILSLDELDMFSEFFFFTETKFSLILSAFVRSKFLPLRMIYKSVL